MMDSSLQHHDRPPPYNPNYKDDNTALLKNAVNVRAEPFVPDDDTIAEIQPINDPDEVFPPPDWYSYDGVVVRLRGNSGNPTESGGTGEALGEAESFGSNETLESDWQPGSQSGPIAHAAQFVAQNIDPVPIRNEDEHQQGLNGDMDQQNNPPPSDDEEDRQGDGQQHGRYYKREVFEQTFGFFLYFKKKFSQTQWFHSHSSS